VRPGAWLLGTALLASGCAARAGSYGVTDPGAGALVVKNESDFQVNQIRVRVPGAPAERGSISCFGDPPFRPVETCALAPGAYEVEVDYEGGHEIHGGHEWVARGSERAGFEARAGEAVVFTLTEGRPDASRRDEWQRRFVPPAFRRWHRWELYILPTALVLLTAGVVAEAHRRAGRPRRTGGATVTAPGRATASGADPTGARTLRRAGALLCAVPAGIVLLLAPDAWSLIQGNVAPVARLSPANWVWALFLSARYRQLELTPTVALVAIGVPLGAGIALLVAAARRRVARRP
jgi:hypothetical protein